MRKPISVLAGWHRVVAATLAMGGLLFGTTKGPDAGGYTATSNAVYSFLDPAGGGSSPSVLAGIDDGVASLMLPFAFQFYGRSYTMVCVSSNGLLYFVNNAAACTQQTFQGDFANTDLTSSAVPGDLPAVAPFWSDLSFAPAGAGAVYYQTVGAAGSQQFVIEWYNAFPSGSVTPVTFEAILFQGTNKVLFQYQNVDLGSGNPASKGAQATVGFRNSGGNSNNQQIQWSYDAGVLGNSSAILLGTTFSPCDVTQDGSTTIADVQAMVNQVLGSAAALSDLNGDGKVNVVDVQIVINAVLGQGCVI